MRFAYIDSNGNEVPIPSVDALGLRIELGAITADTQLYDAQADQWGPAHSHEIFHSLARTTGDDGGFVAPPPPASPRPERATSSKATAVADPPRAEPVAKKKPVDPPAEKSGSSGSFGLTLAPEPEPEEIDEEDEDTDAPGAGLTLAAPNSEFGDAATAAVESFAPDGDTGTTDRSDSSDAPERSEVAERPSGGKPPAASAAESDPAPNSESGEDTAADGTFDFGDLEGGLEVEESEDDGDEEVMDLSPPSAGQTGVVDLETTSQFGPGDFTLDDGQMLDLEAPLYEFDADSPPAWMEQDGPAGIADDDEDVMDFSSVAKPAAHDTAGAAGSVDAKKVTPSKPSPPKRRRQPRNLVAPMIATIALVAVAVGGYVAWPLLSAKLSTPETVVVTGVSLPAIPAELEPQMRSISDAALASTFAEVRRAWSESEPISAPHRDWLGGLYLANAGSYGEVELFWEGMQDRLDGVRGIDLAAFDAAFAAEAATREASPADAEVMRVRADSGFVAGEDERVATYDRLQDLVDAANRLHQFLVANEANIRHAPASSVTTDPVLEVAATPEVRSAMEELIDSVTRALGALEYRDQVTAEGLWHRVLTVVQERGIA